MFALFALFALVINSAACNSIITKRSYYYDYNSQQLPEIIINRAVNSNPGYIYQPSPSFGGDITTEIVPALYNNEIPSYLPFDNNYLLKTSPHVRIFNMSCQDTPTSKFFKTIVHVEDAAMDATPAIEGAKSANCLSGSGHVYQLNIHAQNFGECGINYCADKKLCVQLRLSTVKGLKLSDDTLITLQCKPQITIVSQTKQLLIKPLAVQGRSSETIASGGTQRNFDVHVALYRKSLAGSQHNEFAQVIMPGTSVLLGEDLLIKASVKDGDGWRCARIGAVIIQHQPGSVPSARKSVTLVDNDGCRVQAMKAICPEQPKQVNALTVALPFRAFMFQGTEQGDEMVLSVRMFACLHQEDCIQARHCEEKVQGRTRAKREMKNGTSTRSDGIRDWESYFDFKVIAAPHDDVGTKQDHLIETHQRLFTPMMLIFAIIASIIIIGSILTLMLFIRKNKREWYNVIYNRSI